MTSISIVAYLSLFATVGVLFVFVCLLLGRFFRPDAPTAQKREIYECGEPSIGSGAVRFDLRFYVVALLFLIFEVEVVLFFPPATVFGQANKAQAQWRNIESILDVEEEITVSDTILKSDRWVRVEDVEATEPQKNGFPTLPAAGNSPILPDSARTLSLVALVDMLVFFAVLLVGFAYLWRRGDLDWVRAVRHPATPGEAVPSARLHVGE